MAVTAQLSASLIGTQTSALDLGTPKAQQTLSWLQAFASGTAAFQADLLWTDTRTLTASSTENLDLAGGLIDPFGVIIAFARVRAMVIAADPGNANTVVVGGAASNAWATWLGGTTPTVTVRPGGLLVVAAPDATGFTVAGATGDILKVANGGGGTSVIYSIALLGASV